MSTIVEHAYPRVAWRNRQKMLWNPIHKKALKNLPEERVRLRVIEALMQFGWSKNRMSTEESIGSIGDTDMRTDIICYDRQFEPMLLVECKAEHIPISEKAAEQVGRYNRNVNAPYLLLTNGISDYWYAIDSESDKVMQRDERPPFLDDSSEGMKPDFTYWKDRGFAGEKASSKLQEWIQKAYSQFWLAKDQQVQYLNFGDGPSDVDLSHYYRINAVAEDRRIAVSTLNTAFGGNRMIIILNEEDENKAVLEINLDLLDDEKKGNSGLYSKDGIRTFDLNDYWELWQLKEMSEIAEQANDIFSEYVE
ncbi:type I restriction enzyme HsdR N-terminal domain-containing protein [Fodinibius halophilus]|uniref:Type I restriction enzyme HsdR N-terminal domain-containing protein n=1 Tax=Fodinibius halophilus TaxID=1736908 RepID=A0A6M1T646_9BACT|nr:type I restriction enzyme HsdR N-terminal domain-containing protein [Fodinibius halophilus]NGP87471.1 type I restriction enzyme HsdR N-terminal domain-containing protein [Fodinibius halophilus]